MYRNYRTKLTAILLASMSLLACNGGNNSSNTSSVTTANPLQQYINLLTYTPTQGKQLSGSPGSNQQSFSTPGGIQINSVDIKYYSGADCSGTPTLATTLNGPSTPTAGTYTSSNASNYALCEKYPGNCAGLYNAVHTDSPAVRSIQYTYNLNNGVFTTQCLSNANNNPYGTGAFETILNYSNPTNPVACTSDSSCGYSQPYPVVNLGLSIGSATASGFAGGDGSSGTPYQIQQNQSAPSISYTITNSGAVPATDFYISGSATGWTVGGDCGTAGSKITLPATNGSCTLTMTLSSTATTGAENLDLAGLTMQWVDQDSPSGQTQALSGTSYVNVFTPASIAITTNPVSSISVAPGGSFTVTATLTGGYNVPAQTIQVTTTNSDITFSTSGACQVSSTSNTCSITATASGTAATASGNTVTLSNSTTPAVAQPNPNSISFSIAPPSFFDFSTPYGITLNSAETFAFIVNSGNNTVTQCNVSGGTLSNCKDSGATTLSSPRGITLNAAGTFAFIANSDDNTVTQCSVSSGTLSNCANSGATTLSRPRGITLNAAGTFAFIANYQGSTVTQCSVSGSALSACSSSGANNLSAPQAITLNSAGTFAFIANSGSNGPITRCSVSNGTLSACADSGATAISYPFGITLNSAGTIALITNYIGNTVTQCSMSGGTLSACADSGATAISSPYGITLNSTGTFAFIANSNGTVTQCSVSGGTLSACARTGTQ